MAVCCCALAGTAACQHCSQNPFATDVWTNNTVTVDHVDAKPFGNGLDVCPVCGKPSTIGKPQTNADHIRAMSDEELAQFFHDSVACDDCPVGDSKCKRAFALCKNTALAWLKSQVGVQDG